MSLGFVRPSGRLAVVGLLATFTMLAAGWEAQARARKQPQAPAGRVPSRRKSAGRITRTSWSTTRPAKCSTQSRPTRPRHPASLAKVMTLYLLFEQLEAGKLKLDTPLEVPPTPPASAR